MRRAEFGEDWNLIETPRDSVRLQRAGLDKYWLKDICLPRHKRPTTLVLLCRGFLIYTIITKQLLCLDLISSVYTGAGSPTFKPRPKETDRGISPPSHFCSFCSFLYKIMYGRTVTDMNRLFMLEKKNIRMQNFAGSAVRSIEFCWCLMWPIAFFFSHFFLFFCFSYSSSSVFFLLFLSV